MLDLATRLAQRRAAHLYRTRRVFDGPQGPQLHSDGRTLLAFCSNDYLGLAAHPKVIEALCAGARRYGVGSGAAHLICGHSHAHHALEEELAAFLNRPRALLFSTGYMANVGALSALVARRDTVIADRYNHASLLDGALLAHARLQRYAHGDANAAQQRLAAASGHAWLVTDGVFSMDGDLAPLPALVQIAHTHAATLVVDDAHGIGVLGATGRGTLEHFGLSDADVPVLIGTLGKACGGFGAFVAGSEALIETLIQEARSYIYTTAMPPAVAEAARMSLRLIQDEPQRRTHLHALIQRFRDGAQRAGFGARLSDSTTPIQPLHIGAAADALQLSEALLARGILISAIRPPTVPAGSARLRITLSAAHSEAQVDHLLETLAAVL